MGNLIEKIKTQLLKNKAQRESWVKQNADIFHYKYTDLVVESKYLETFLEMLKNYPTCSPLERQFLDELREKGELDGFSWSNKRWIKMKGSQETVIYPDDFNTPLEGLVNE